MIATEALLTMRLPVTPDRRLAPNRSKGRDWRALHPLIAAERWRGKVIAGPWLTRAEPYTGPVRVDVVIAWGKSLHGGKKPRLARDRRLDWDSATVVCKALLDGALVDSGILADDRQIVAGTVYQAIDPAGDGYTDVTIYAVEVG